MELYRTVPHCAAPSSQGMFTVGVTGTLTYQELYGMVSKALYRTHVEGKLKSEIIQVGGR